MDTGQTVGITATPWCGGVTTSRNIPLLTEPQTARRIREAGWDESDRLRQQLAHYMSLYMPQVHSHRSSGKGALVAAEVLRCDLRV
jgi:hypothetical protein